MQIDSKKIRKLYLFQILLNFIGIALSVYLLVQHTRLMAGIQEGRSFCSFGGLADCDVVNGSKYSEIFGIPIAAFGIVYYFLLFILGIVTPPKERQFRTIQAICAWLLAFGLGFDLVYFGIQVFILKTLCVMCLLTYVVIGGGLYLSYSLSPKAGSVTERLKGLFLNPHGWIAPHWTSARMLMAYVSIILSVTVVAFLPSVIRSKGATYSHVDDAVEQFFTQWKEKQSKKIEPVEGNGTWGNPNAKVRIVEFSDFECPFCRKAAFTIHTVLKPFKDRVYFVFKNFPLDSSCNPQLPYQIHAHACKLAKLSVCASQKGKFWDLHDQLFLKMSDDDMKEGWDSIKSKFSSILSDAEVNQCLESGTAKDSVANDLKQGATLNVRGTPTIFINGKHVSIPITVETLRRLIELEESLSK